MLLEILEREGQHANAHTLDTHLRKAGKTRKLLRASATPHIRFERDHVNSLWQSDVTDGPWLPDPARPGHMRRTHLIAFLDDHSRLVPYGEFFFDEALPRLERVLKVALLRRGVPDAMYVDNGQIFNATQFRAACATSAHRNRVCLTLPSPREGKNRTMVEPGSAIVLPGGGRFRDCRSADLEPVVLGLAGSHLPRARAWRNRPDPV